MGILSLSGITKIYRKGEIEVVALGGINLEFDKEEFCAIVGPSARARPRSSTLSVVWTGRRRERCDTATKN